MFSISFKHPVRQLARHNRKGQNKEYFSRVKEILMSIIVYERGSRVLTDKYTFGVRFPAREMTAKCWKSLCLT